MRPAELVADSFNSYSVIARRFALQHLSLLRRLPMAVCPSFLQQIQKLGTSFPFERDALRRQCDSLQSLNSEKYAALAAPLEALSIPSNLQSMDWVEAPEGFINELTAFLWSSGQIGEFRSCTNALFAAIPARVYTNHRLVFVVLGQGAHVEQGKALRKLSNVGVLLTSLKADTAFYEIRNAMAQHAGKAPAPYASWYIDGGVISPETRSSLPDAVLTSYPGLAALRDRVLTRMQVALTNGSGGAEQMRTRLARISPGDVGAAEITLDPVLQRFYTDLFTQSSGPQIFSTSFVQWAGREIARRAQPSTLLLRYAPRQSHRDLNEMFAPVRASSFDPQGSFRDAEMGAYYNWIESQRITAPGKLTFVAWIEDRSLAVIVGANSPAGTICSTPMTIAQGLENFG